MFYETGNKVTAKAGSKPAIKPPQQLAQGARSFVNFGTQKQPVTPANTTTLIATATTPPTAKITGWPVHGQPVKKTAISAPVPKVQSQKQPAVSVPVKQQKKTVTGWPSNATAKKITKPINPTAPKIQPRLVAKNPIKQVKKTVTGWPVVRQNAARTKSTSTGVLKRPQSKILGATSIKKGTKPIGGWSKWAQGSQKVQVPSITRAGGWSTYQKDVRKPRFSPGVSSGQQGNNVAPGLPTASKPVSNWSNSKNLNRKRYINNNGSSIQYSRNYKGAASSVPVQTTITGWPSNQHTIEKYQTSSDSHSCNCAKCKGQAPANTIQQPIQNYNSTENTNGSPIANDVTNTNINSASGEPACHTCGLTGRGCTTLRGFSFNSTLINPFHKIQLRKLASQILQKNSNTVIATGHTDSSGTEEFNEDLSERRALAVVAELKKHLSNLKPGAQKNLFWKTDSKAQRQPDTNNASKNRRVEICVRQLNQ